jgi:hypothetical protein
MSRLAPVLGLLAGLALAPAAAHGEIYRWVDEQGVERFSDRIESVPERFRRDVTEELRHDPAGPSPAATVAPPEPAALAAEPDVPTPEAPSQPPAALPDWSEKLFALGLVAVLAAAGVGLALSLVLMAFALRLACRAVGEEVPGFGRAIAVSAVQIGAGMAMGMVLGGVAVAGLLDPTSLSFQGAQLLVSFGISVTVIQAMLGIGFGRAIAIAIVAMLITIAIGIAIALGIAVLLGGLVAASAG